MVFSRLFFIYLFFPICFLCYFATKKTSYRNAVLIVFSLLFYACGDISFLWLVVASALVNFVLGRGIDKFRDKTPAKAFLALGLVLNLGTLVGFKYTGFFIENLNSWFSLSIPVPDLRCRWASAFSRSARFPISSTVRGAKSRRNEISSRSCCTFPFSRSPFPDRSHGTKPCRQTCTSGGVCRRP
ncbi:MAG: hypothetical protein ACLSFT_03810 [Ruminococcus callidus]